MGDAIWPLWIVAAIVSFALIEGYAIKTGRIRTLSRTIWDWSRAWPPLPFVLGQVSGGLAVHFWWNWCPA